MWEFVILVVVGLIVLGPERLPEYAAKLGRLVRQARTMAENARSQLGDELGPEFKDVDWEQFDPRRYDPRRIVREALLDDGEDDGGADGEVDGDEATGPARPTRRTSSEYDPLAATPYDVDAT
jgi:sec-independent protein translocase protein TatB